MEKNEIIKKIEEIVTPFLEKINLSLVDVEYLQEGGYWYVRIYIENLEGDLSIEDCTRVSQAVENDIEELIDKKFFLEVSSPGLERPLKKIEDFKRFIGNKVKIQLKNKYDDKKQYIAFIKAVENENIIFNLDEDKELKFKLNEIKKANILFEFTDF